MDLKTLTILLTLLLAGCSTTATGSLCTVGPFIHDPGAVDRWTANEKDQLLVLNRSGAEICGWRKP